MHSNVTHIARQAPAGVSEASENHASITQTQRQRLMQLSFVFSWMNADPRRSQFGFK